PGMTELEVEEQGPAEADAIKHLVQDVHLARLIRWTVRHNIRTIRLYRLEMPHIRSCRDRSPRGAAPHRQTADGTPAASPKRLPALRTQAARHSRRTHRCEISYARPPPSSWPEQHLAPPPNRPIRRRAPRTISFSSMAP